MALRVSVYMNEHGEEITNIDFDSPEDFSPYVIPAPDDVDLSPLIEAAKIAQRTGDESINLLKFLGQSPQG